MRRALLKYHLVSVCPKAHDLLHTQILKIFPILLMLLILLFTKEPLTSSRILKLEAQVHLGSDINSAISVFV